MIVNTPPAGSGKVSGFTVVVGKIGEGQLSVPADIVCDGTNDVVQLQAAFTRVAQQGGGTIRLLSGTYNITNINEVLEDGGFQLSSCCIVSGESADSTKFIVPAEGARMDPYWSEDPAQSLEIKDLTISSTGTSTYQATLSLGDWASICIHDCKLFNCSIENAGYPHVKDIQVQHCSITNSLMLLNSYESIRFNNNHWTQSISAYEGISACHLHMWAQDDGEIVAAPRRIVILNNTFTRTDNTCTDHSSEGNPRVICNCPYTGTFLNVAQNIFDHVNLDMSSTKCNEDDYPSMHCHVTNNSMKCANMQVGAGVIECNHIVDGGITIDSGKVANNSIHMSSYCNQDVAISCWMDRNPGSRTPELRITGNVISCKKATSTGIRFVDATTGSSTPDPHIVPSYILNNMITGFAAAIVDYLNSDVMGNHIIQDNFVDGKIDINMYGSTVYPNNGVQKYQSNANQLVNWYFPDPINQRGQTSYGKGYVIDRWRISSISSTGLSLQLTSDGVVFAKTEADTYGSFNQRLDNVGWMTGKTVTFSMLAKGNTDPYMLIYFNGENTGTGTTSVSLTDDWDLYTITKTITRNDITSAQISIGYQKADPVGNTIIQAAKFELGSQQTLAHQDEAGNWVLNDPPPDPALELAKCQRYFVRLPLLPYQSIGIAQGFTGTRARLSLYLPQPMRATPSLTAPPGDIFQLVESPSSEATSPFAHLSTSATSLSNNILTLELNPQDGVSLSVGQTYIVRNKETSAYIDISSE